MLICYIIRNVVIQICMCKSMIAIERGKNMKEYKKKFIKVLSMTLALVLLVTGLNTTTFAEESTQVTFEVEFINLGNDQGTKTVSYTETITENGEITVSYPSSSMADVNKDGSVFQGWTHQGVLGDSITITNPKEGKVYTARATYENENKSTITFTLNFLEQDTDIKIAPSVSYRIDASEERKVSIPEVAGYIIVKEVEDAILGTTIDGSNVLDYKITLKEGKATEINVYFKSVEGADFKRSSFTVKYMFEDENGDYIENQSLRVHGEADTGATINPSKYFLETVPNGFEVSTRPVKNQPVTLVTGENNVVKVHYDRVVDDLIPLTITYNRLLDNEIKATKEVVVYLTEGSVVNAEDYLLTSEQLINNYHWPIGFYTGVADKASIDSLSSENNTLTINYAKSNKANYPYTVKYVYKVNGEWVEIPGSTKSVDLNGSTVVTEYARYFNGYELKGNSSFVQQNVKNKTVIEFQYTVVNAVQLNISVNLPDGTVSDLGEFKVPSGVAVNAEDYVDLTSDVYSTYELDTAQATTYTPSADDETFTIYLKKKVVDNGNNNNNNDDDDDNSGDDLVVYNPPVANVPAAVVPVSVTPVVNDADEETTDETETIEDNEVATGDGTEDSTEDIDDEDVPTTESPEESSQGQNNLMMYLLLLLVVLAAGGITYKKLKKAE